MCLLPLALGVDGDVSIFNLRPEELYFFLKKEAALYHNLVFFEPQLLDYVGGFLL